MTQPQVFTDIEAKVKDTGDVMTGNLRIQYENPTLAFQNNAFSKTGLLKFFDNGTFQIYTTDSEPSNWWLGTNTSQLLLYSSDVQSEISKRFLVGWDGQTYSVYHSGNKPSLKDLAYLGRNLTTSDTDTVDFWANLGTGYCIIDTLGVLQNQPYQWCWLWSYVYSGWVIQELHGANRQSIWRRYGLVGRNNNIFEGDPMWKTILDSSNFSSYALPLTGGTINGKLIINNTNDVVAGTENSGALLIGPPTGAHIAIDANEIMAKGSGTTTSTLYLNNEGGLVEIGSGGLKVKGKITASSWETSATSFIRHAIEKGTVPSSTSWREIIWKDATGTASTDNYGIVGNSVSNANVVQTFMRVYKPISGNGDSATIYLQSDASGNFKAGTTNAAFYGAVWNDYAEYRGQNEIIPPGYCAVPDDAGRLSKTSYRLQACDGIVSDTYGFAIGETDECQTPLAVAGRVLAYCEGNRYDYHAGDTVGAGPEGKVVKMTREEIREYPDRIIGHVSEIPEYEIWGTGQVSVDNRIWIKVK